VELDEHNCRRIASMIFLITALISTHYYILLNFNNLLALTGGLFTATITAGIWLETSYRFLLKEATAPLDKIVEKL